MSCRALSGTRMTIFKRFPAGLKNIWTVTSLGISWAARRGETAKTTSTAAAATVRNATLFQCMAGKINRWTPLLTSKFRFRLRANCVYFGARSVKFAAVVEGTARHGKRTVAFREDNAMKRNVSIGLSFLALIAALGFGSRVFEKRASVQAASMQVPMFEVDPMWPKPLPNHWVIGMTIGVSVVAQDHVWIIHRQGSPGPKGTHSSANPPMADCCTGAPPILAFDQDGNLV